MPTIQEILAARKILIPEHAALRLLGLANNEKARLWLRGRLAYHLAELRCRTYLFEAGAVRNLRAELDTLEKFPRRHR